MKSEETVYDKAKYNKVNEKPQEPKNETEALSQEKSKNQSARSATAGIGAGRLMGGIGAFAATEAFAEVNGTDSQNRIRCISLVLREIRFGLRMDNFHV